MLADVGEGIDETPAEEYIMMLEVVMADCPGQPHPPAFSWNMGMVMHIMKSDPVLRDLEHVQVDGLGTGYLFFYDKQGHYGLGQDTTYAIWAHGEEAFSEWILHSASLHGYPGKWAHTLDKGKDISVQDLLMHMEKTFGNKDDYDAMIRTLYEVQQKEDETVEEYMLHLHDTVTVIRQAYPERLPNQGRDLKKDHFYHGLHSYLHDVLSFAMAELPKREQAHLMFDMLYTLAKKLEAGQPVHACRYAPSSEPYREKHRHYPVPVGRVAALEGEGVVSADPASGEDSDSEVEAVDGLNVCLAQAMSHYQREEHKCFICRSPGHFARDCTHHDTFKRWHWEQLNTKGAGENSQPTPRRMNQQPEVNVCVTGWIQDPLLEAGGPISH